MTPTPEQLEAIETQLCESGPYPWGEHPDQDARNAWNIIAPIVLEEAAKLCDDFDERQFNDDSNYGDSVSHECADRIRALMDKP